MKNKFKLTCIISALYIVSSAQAPYWKLNGNPGPASASPDNVNTTNNYLGTNATNNTFLKIGVQGSQDIMIDNDNSKLYPADGSGRLHGGHWIGMGRVFTPTAGPGSWSFFTPKAHLHIDGSNTSGQWSSFGNGIRTWFNTGTLYTENSDAMYVGLRNIGTNFSYAVINWSDDAYGGAGGSDFLSFNFTGAPGVLAPTTNGMELGRFNPTPGKGTLGVGNFQFIGASTEPVRRLEILDADPSSGVNANAPQLRTTYTYNATPTGGVFTEFQTTNLGDMYFNTRSNGNARRFGFHDNTPGNTVEITANGSSPIPVGANGTSGLRFTNMTSANTPQVNPGAGVLSVDANGDVIYVPGGGAGIANNGISVNAGVTQLGVPCSVANIPAILANQFTSDRIIANRNQNLWIASLNNETGGMGVGGQPVLPFCNLGNTFEISANSKNTQYGTAGSGLRFTKLTSSSATIPNGVNGVNSAKVLTVDGDGDVVLTDVNATPITNNGISISSGTVQLGVDCSSSIPVKIANRLLTNRMIHLNGKNMIFADGGRVGIGQGLLNCTVGNKLEINSGPGIAPYGTNIVYSSGDPNPCGSSGTRMAGTDDSTSTDASSNYETGIIPQNYNANVATAQANSKQFVDGMAAVKINSNASIANNNLKALAKAQICLESKDFTGAKNHLKTLAPSASLVESNLATVLDILTTCKQEGRYEYTKAEEATLLSIAASDSRIGGQGVHYARGIVLISFNRSFEDPYLSNTASPAAKRNKLNTTTSNEQKQLIGLYPNPAKTNITVTTTNGPKTISVYNNMGAKVYSHTTDGTLTIDVSSWTSGVYLTEIYDATANKKETNTFIIE